MTDQNPTTKHEEYDRQIASGETPCLNGGGPARAFPGSKKPPAIGSRWRHYNGTPYTVLHIANEPDVDRYPKMVIYQGPNGKIWARTPRESCPHVERTMAYHAWQAGWWKAEIKELENQHER